MPALKEIILGPLRSRLLRASGLVLSSNLLGGLMNFASVVLTIRYISKEDFGVLTVAITTMQLVGMLSNVGLNETIVTMVSRSEAAGRAGDSIRSLSAIFRVRLIVLSAVAAGGMALSGRIAGGVFHNPALTLPISMGILGACGVSLNQYSLTILQALRSYGRFSSLMLVRFGAIFLAISALAAAGRLDLNSALVVNALAPFLAFGLSLVFAPVRAGLLEKVGGDRGEVLREIWEQSKWVIVLNLCAIFFSRLEIYLLMSFTTASELGLYGAAFRLCGGVLLVETAVRTVLFPEVTRKTGEGLPAAMRRSVGPLLMLSGLIYAIGLVMSPFIPWFLGEAYSEAVPIFLILLLARTALIPLTPLGLLFYAASRTRAGAVSGIVQLATLLASGLLLIPAYGASGAAWTQVTVSAVAAVYLVMFARPYLTSYKAAAEAGTVNTE